MQAIYLDYDGRVERQATVFRVLLGLTLIGALAYLSYVFLRLRENARALTEQSSVLQARLAFEGLITAISTHFINLPSDQVDNEINRALQRLAEHTAADRADIFLFIVDGTRVAHTHAWPSAGKPAPVDRLMNLSGDEFLWLNERFGRHGGMHVPCVGALPATRERAILEEQGIQSWLCLPMWCAGKRVGFLSFDTARVEKCWSEDDIALLRTVGEIFANALERRQPKPKGKRWRPGCVSRRSWRPSAPWPAASPTTSTTFSARSSATAKWH